MPSRSKNISSSVGDRIKHLRLSNNMTQKELADALYKSESAIRMWELGKSEPDIETLKMIADYFRISADYLIGTYNDIVKKKKRQMQERIKALRVYKRMSQDEFANMFHVSQIDVANWESGKDCVDIEIAKRIAEKFSVPLEFVCGADFKMERPENLWYEDQKEDKRSDHVAGVYYDFLYGNGKILNSSDEDNDFLMPFQKNSHSITIRGRDGSVIESDLTDEQIELFKQMLKQVTEKK